MQGDQATEPAVGPSLIGSRTKSQNLIFLGTVVSKITVPHGHYKDL
jgi:hypothetical protein